MAEVWMAKEDLLTPTDIDSIRQLGQWTERIEISFMTLFVIIAIFSLLSNRIGQKTISSFIKYNAILIVCIFMLSAVFHFTTTLTTFELLLPLINLATVTVIVATVLVIERVIRVGLNRKVGSTKI